MNQQPEQVNPLYLAIMVGVTGFAGGVASMLFFGHKAFKYGFIAGPLIFAGVSVALAERNANAMLSAARNKQGT